MLVCIALKEVWSKSIAHLAVSIWHSASNGNVGCLWILLSPISLETSLRECHPVAPHSKAKYCDCECFMKSH